GIDRAVNAAFLRRLADAGGGSCELVESEERLDQVMDQVHRAIGTPVLTGLQLRSAGLDLAADTLLPARPPDLFTGTPVLMSGRYRGKSAGTIRIAARDAAGQDWATEVQAWKTETPVGPIWARGRVRDLEDRYVLASSARSGEDRAKLEHEIVETSLRFKVLSRFTAFVAVDPAEVVNPGGEQKPGTPAVDQPPGPGGPPAPAAPSA